MESKWRKRWDMVKEVIFFLIVTAFVFGWWMLVLLIISFVTLSVLHFTIEGIVITSIVGTVGVDIYYVIHRVKEFKKP
ncbi:MAG: hypothetical protein J1E01_00205 [Acetatifactor sp.]|nr:hypothetical protein [Acetatifactor sp.]